MIEIGTVKYNGTIKELTGGMHIKKVDMFTILYVRHFYNKMKKYNPITEDYKLCEQVINLHLCSYVPNLTFTFHAIRQFFIITTLLRIYGLMPVNFIGFRLLEKYRNEFANGVSFMVKHIIEVIKKIFNVK